MSKRKGNLKTISLCCGADVDIKGALDFMSDASTNDCTQYYVCSECGKPCDSVTTYVKDRQVWTISPVTRVVPNKKKRSSTKLSVIELREIHQSEDF